MTLISGFLVIVVWRLYNFEPNWDDTGSSGYLDNKVHFYQHWVTIMLLKISKAFSFNFNCLQLTSKLSLWLFGKDAGISG